ncbi:MAG TPA: CBS domain-containing protein [Candidatus Dormibacteraeota bacterium]|nr:CBS domain-containing protein [Candidatus Dormibacteraeota bacterium]
MRVKDVMTGTPVSCRLETNLAAASEMLWNQNCGILPVANDKGKVVGVITDRDMCIALGTRNRLAADIAVGEVISGKLFSCGPEDDLQTVLTAIGKMQVRRMPVIDAKGKLVGLVSMDDLVLHSEPRAPGKTPALSHDDVMLALKKLYQRQVPELARREAAA